MKHRERAYKKDFIGCINPHPNPKPRTCFEASTIWVVYREKFLESTVFQELILSNLTDEEECSFV